MGKLIDEVSLDITMWIRKPNDREIQLEELEVRAIECGFVCSSRYLVTGRGRLYYWGPNHAGDPVVTR